MRPNWFATLLVASGVGAIVAVALVFSSGYLGLPSSSIPVGPSLSPLGASTSLIHSAVTAEPIKSSWVLVVEALAWPMALLLTLALIAWNNRIRRFFGVGPRFIKKISAGGVEMEINSETVDEVRKQLSDSFQELVENAREEYQRMADVQDISLLLKAVMQSNLLIPAKQFSLRGTVHVKDIIFSDYLYQLVDYYPYGEGSHRRFSQRYGIIGRTWRAKKSIGTGDALAAPDNSTEALINNWGMTLEEAQGRLNDRHSCLSIILHSGGIPIGVLYIDSKSRNAFGEQDKIKQLITDLEKSLEVTRLTDALVKTLAPLKMAAPDLNLARIK